MPVKNISDTCLGILLMGGAGALIGVLADSRLLSASACIFGIAIGFLLGWLGARRYMLIIFTGAALGTAAGYSSGDRDVLIIAAGSGAAIAGFIGAQAEAFLRGRQ